MPPFFLHKLLITSYIIYTHNNVMEILHHSSPSPLSSSSWSSSWSSSSSSSSQQYMASWAIWQNALSTAYSWWYFVEHTLILSAIGLLSVHSYASAYAYAYAHLIQYDRNHIAYRHHICIIFGVHYCHHHHHQHNFVAFVVAIVVIVCWDRSYRVQSSPVS